MSLIEHIDLSLMLQSLAIATFRGIIHMFTMFIIGGMVGIGV